MLNYEENFLSIRNATREKLQHIKNKFGDIAIFGAGHLSTMYLNIMNISNGFKGLQMVAASDLSDETK